MECSSERYESSIVPNSSVSSSMASQPMIDLTPPSWDPKDVYPPLPEALKSVDFDLSKRLKDRFQSHLSCEELEDRSEALKKTLEYLQTQKSNFMGYQVNHKIDYIEDIQSFINIHLNNIGDAFQEANLTTSTKFMERAVLDYYASLWNAKWPHNDDADPEGNSFWGFLLTMGSTEGNMYAMWNARDYLSGKVLIIENDPSIGQPRMVFRQAEVPVDTLTPYFGADGSALKRFCDNYYSPVMFYSEDTHYSFTKASHLTSLPTFGSVGNEKYPEQCPIKTADGKWPDEVPSNDDGTINIDKLSILVDFFAQQGHPVLISLNYGSTFKGAYDNVEEVAKALAPIFTKYHMWNRDCCLLEDKIERRGFWIHVDGALGASYMPYLRMALQDPRYKLKDGSAIPLAPAFDFGVTVTVTVDSKKRKEEMVHSISVSGHKWIGAPFPCGVYMSKRRYQITPPSNPTYIGTPDTTFAGSRNGLSALLLWSYLSKKTLHQQIEKAVYCENMASSINEKMTKLGEWLKNEGIIDDLWVARTPLALTVRFRQLAKDLTLKYSLSNESLMVDGEVRYYSHVFSMEHVTDQLVDQLVNEIKSLGKNAFADQLDGKTKAALAGLPSPLDSARLIATVPFKGRGFS